MSGHSNADPSQSLEILREESFIVTELGGVLEVWGDDFEAALGISGDIVAANWCDCRGSVGQHLVRAVAHEPQGALVRLGRSVESSVPDSSPLAIHFEEFGSILVPGQYKFVLEDLPVDSYVVEQDMPASSVLEVTSFYPGYGAMVATQARSALSNAAVERHAQAIRKGERPIVVTVSPEGAWAEFIIDGHHKLLAYQREITPIRRLNIIRQQGPRASLKDLLAFLPEAGSLREHLCEHRPRVGPSG